MDIENMEIVRESRLPLQTISQDSQEIDRYIIG